MAGAAARPNRRPAGRGLIPTRNARRGVPRTVTAQQIPMPPDAGFAQLVETAPYPSFPTWAVERWRWAHEAPIRNQPAKMALVVLALHADKDGKAWPSFGTIQRLGSMGRSTVIDAIQRLEDAGWLTVYRRVRRTSLYFLKAPKDQHCRGCWRALPAETQLCPVCGYELGVRELDPKFY